MRRTGKLVIFVAVFLALSSILVAAAMADDNGPIGITDTPTPTATVPPTGVVPEASTLVLLASSATGLAAYAGLQIRARRRRP
jgi:heme/copper-type cytochrome/quinol oxidase subunit 3